MQVIVVADESLEYLEYGVKVVLVLLCKSLF
jgi:hypothetical protein